MRSGDPKTPPEASHDPTSHPASPPSSSPMMVSASSQGSTKVPENSSFVLKPAHPSILKSVSSQGDVVASVRDKEVLPRSVHRASPTELPHSAVLEGEELRDCKEERQTGKKRKHKRKEKGQKGASSERAASKSIGDLEKVHSDWG